jgi:transcriptional regulator with XRE-family HTH domain
VPGLLAARQRAQLTQQRLASRADVAISALARIEQGKVEARALTIWRLAHALDVTPETLTGGVPLVLTAWEATQVARLEADQQALAS